MIKEIAFADQDKEVIVSLTISGYDIDQIKTYLSEFGKSSDVDSIKNSIKTLFVKSKK